MYIKSPTTRFGPQKSGFIDEKRRQETPHVIDCVSLNDEVLGWTRYASELQERRDWCEQCCRDDWEIEPLRDRRMRLIGRRYRFADVVDAIYFKLRFY